MEVLRGLLFVGLILHKLLWEALKRKGRKARTQPQSPHLFLRRFVKFLKGGAFVFLAVQTLFLDLFPISDSPAPLRIIGTVLYVVGFATAVTGRLQLGDNWVDLEDYGVLPEQSLVTTGIYRYLRHPMYTGDALLLVGLELSLNSWLVLGVAVPLLVICRQVVAEEALLSRSFPDYTAYCVRTKRFIPFFL